MYSQQLTADSTSATSEFILSVRSTVAPNHMMVDSFVVNGPATGITENNLFNFSVSPNPSHGNISVKNLILGDKISVYDLTGKIIFSQTISFGGNINLNLKEKNI